MPTYLPSVLVRFALAAAFAASIAACGGGDDDASPTPINNPAEAVRQAARATAVTEVYQERIEFSPIGSPIVYLVHYNDGDWFERIPDDYTKPPAKEYIFVGEVSYGRDCTAPDVCGTWLKANERPNIPSLAGSLNSIPETLAPIAIDFFSGDWAIVPTAGEAKFRGMTALTPAIRENQGRALLDRGYSEEEMQALVEEINKNQAELGPSVIEVTLTPDYLLSHVTIFTPGQTHNPYLDIQYTYDETVEIEEPDDSLPAPGGVLPSPAPAVPNVPALPGG
jgi:hypothetical protein